MSPPRPTPTPPTDANGSGDDGNGNGHGSNRLEGNNSGGNNSGGNNGNGSSGEGSGAGAPPWRLLREMACDCPRPACLRALAGAHAPCFRHPPPPPSPARPADDGIGTSRQRPASVAAAALSNSMLEAALAASTAFGFAPPAAPQATASEPSPPMGAPEPAGVGEEAWQEGEDVAPPPAKRARSQ